MWYAVDGMFGSIRFGSKRWLPGRSAASYQLWQLDTAQSLCRVDVTAPDRSTSKLFEMSGTWHLICQHHGLESERCSRKHNLVAWYVGAKLGLGGKGMCVDDQHCIMEGGVRMGPRRRRNYSMPRYAEGYSCALTESHLYVSILAKLLAYASAVFNNEFCAAGSSMKSS